MKPFILSAVLLCLGISAFSQTRNISPLNSFHIGAGYGMNANNYEVLDAKVKKGATPVFEAMYRAQPFPVGVMVGLGYGMLSNELTLNETFAYDKVHADNNNEYTHTTYFKDWKETQKYRFIEFKVQATYYKGLNERFALLAGFGPRWRALRGGKYTASGDQYKVDGYFPSTNITYEDLPNHGFLTVEGKQKGKIQDNGLQTGCGVDISTIYTLNEKNSIYFSLYYEYWGKVKKERVGDPLVGDIYQGVYNSRLMVDKAPHMMGIKIGFILHSPHQSRWNYE